MAPERLHLTPQAALARLVPHILEMESRAHHRIAIGFAGGPGTGKSTLAAELVTMLNAVKPGSAALVPMDGFHMKHKKLEALGTVADKGMPHTFEGALFAEFLGDLKTATSPVNGPGYSRDIEDTVDNAFTVGGDVRILIVEGNYLLLATAPWWRVKPLLDRAVFIEIAREMVRARLMKRHGEEGLFTEERNRAHVERVDLSNYDLVLRSAPRADVVIRIVTES